MAKSKAERQRFRNKRPVGFMNTSKQEDKHNDLNAVGLPIDKLWYKVDGTVIEDLESYLYSYIGNNPDNVIKFLIGTDGMAKPAGHGKTEMKMLTVICLQKVGKGVHVICRRENTSHNYYVETATKLNTEINKTFELAQYLDSIGITFEVHLDVNPNRDFDSFNVYNTIHGFFESFGYKTEYKPVAPAASYASDYFL